MDFRIYASVAIASMLLGGVAHARLGDAQRENVRQEADPAFERDFSELMSKLPIVTEKQGYRALFFEMARLRLLPETPNPHLRHALSDFEPPREWKHFFDPKLGGTRSWPPQLSDLDAILQKSLGADPQAQLPPEQLNRLTALLRLENKIRRMDRLPATTEELQALKKRLLRQMVIDEIQALDPHLLKFRIHLPDSQGGYSSMPMGELLKKLTDPQGSVKIPLKELITMAGEARGQARALRGDTADDAADLWDALAFKQRKLGESVPPINRIRAALIPGGTLSGILHGAGPNPSFYVQPPGEKGEANACIVDTYKTMTPPMSAAEMKERRKQAPAGTIGFRIQSHSASLNAKGMASSCMAGIHDRFERAPGKPGETRFVLFTASHCIPEGISSLDILGIGSVRRDSMKVYKMPGKADMAAVAIDLPEDIAFRLKLDESRFVSLPDSDRPTDNQPVMADIHFAIPGSNVTKLIGKTFSIPGAGPDDAFRGVNFRENGGAGIYPGTSGSPVYQRAGGKNVFLGAVSYKCTDDNIFASGIGGIASGNRVLSWLNETLQNQAYSVQTPSAMLARHTTDREVPDLLAAHRAAVPIE